MQPWMKYALWGILAFAALYFLFGINIPQRIYNATGVFKGNNPAAGGVVPK